MLKVAKFLFITQFEWKILKNILLLTVRQTAAERLLRVYLSNVPLSATTNTVKKHHFVTVLAILFSVMSTNLTTGKKKYDHFPKK